ncbi:hypothetical protein ACW9KT_16220 [Hymenobacter sp. HD11105]
MAEINIQRKKSSFSPWLLILLVLAALAVGAYFLLRADSDPAVQAPPATEAVTPGADTEAEIQARATVPPADGTSTQAVTAMAAEETPVSAEELARFATDEDDTPDYGRRGLQLLSATLVDLADRDDLRSDSNIIEKRNDLTSATSRLTEGAGIRPGLVAAVALMQAIQQKAYPALARPVTDLAQRADELPNQVTPADATQLREFFVRAADVVGTLSKPAA